MHKKVTLSIESSVYDKFKRYCDDNAIMLSKRVELCMKKILDESKGGRNDG
jgi:hypothetical protein